VDIHDFFRGHRPWGQLYRFIAQLPPHSRYHAALVADEDSVRRLLSDKPGDGRLSMAGWTPERDLLTTIAEILNEMHATLIQANSEKGKRPATERMPRPWTAFEKVAAKQAYDEHKQRVRLFLARSRDE